VKKEIALKELKTLPSEKRNKLIIDICNYVILVIGSIVMLAPLVWMINASLKVTSNDIYHGFFNQWHWANFVEVLTRPLNASKTFWDGFLNSVIVAVPSIIIGSLVTAFGAYAFAKIKFVGRDIVFILILGVMMIPFPIIMIPQFTIFSELGWVGTLLPLIVPKMLGNVMMMFFLRQYLSSIPDALIESAQIDGAGHLKIFFKIIFPLLLPALAAQMILWFLGVWNDFLGPSIFAKDNPTLPVLIATFTSVHNVQSEDQLNMAASLLSMIPVLTVFAIFQKQIIESVMLSGSKE
jgi:multiple sugar transport system permease protein